jgi:hypothetical protein
VEPGQTLVEPVIEQEGVYPVFVAWANDWVEKLKKLNKKSVRKVFTK